MRGVDVGTNVSTPSLNSEYVEAVSRINLLCVHKAAFLTAATRGKGLPAPWKVYGTVTEPLIWPADVPTPQPVLHTTT